ncbi:transcriptional regulator ATRX homolog isoform X2 [Folsomia candida]|uniref:transcriptional regulator ATRX homolog isoform X2 n=1 Tax=Folsomia candida TaxID=158441 RepID=UPI0016053933|nr:transcriptional regulator ATRX homolog isoform X2 [Folsomia candida]
MSYESFQKYNSSYNDGVASYQPNSVDLVICDEANVLKNDATNRVKNLITFKAPKVWMGFTGTPYQNNVAERCNFVRFFRRGTPLDVPSYQAQHCRVITSELERHGKLVSLEGKQMLLDLRQIIPPVMHFRINTLNIERHEITLCIPLAGHPDYYRNHHKFCNTASTADL